MDDETVLSLKPGLPYLWGVVGLLIAVLFFAVAPSDALSDLVDEKGRAGGVQVGKIVFVAIFTAPATLGFIFITWLTLFNDEFRQISIHAKVLWVGLIFGATGLLCGFLGVGVAPDFERAIRTPGAGPIWLMPLKISVGAYLTSYTFPMSICAAIIGPVVAVQIRYHQVVASEM